MKTEKIKIKIWDLKWYLEEEKKVKMFNSKFDVKTSNMFEGDKGYLRSFK